MTFTIHLSRAKGGIWCAIAHTSDVGERVQTIAAQPGSLMQVMGQITNAVSTVVNSHLPVVTPDDGPAPGTLD